jgi:hypothetical protein
MTGTWNWKVRGVWIGVLTPVVWLCLERDAVDLAGRYSALGMIDR